MATPDITGGFDPEESSKTKAVEENMQKLVHKAFASAGHSGQKLKNFLNGTWLGHPLHAVLTRCTRWRVDSSTHFRRNGEFATASEAAVAIGIAGALGAAVTGLTDWQDADAPARRLGMIHGILNLSGTALFIASLISRRRKSRGLGQILGVLGYGVMTAAARLGGQMVYEHRVGVDRTAGQTFSADFATVLGGIRSGRGTAQARGTRWCSDSLGPPWNPDLCTSRDMLAFQRAAVGRQPCGRQHSMSLAPLAIRNVRRPCA